MNEQYFYMIYFMFILLNVNLNIFQDILGSSVVSVNLMHCELTWTHIFY